MKINKTWIIAGVLIVVGVGALIGGIYIQKKRAIESHRIDVSPNDVSDTTSNTTGEMPVPTVQPTSTLQAGEDMSLKAVKYIELPKDLFSQNFQWQKPVKVDNLGMFVKNYSEGGCDGPGCTYYSDQYQAYFQIANFKYNNQDGTIILTSHYSSDWGFDLSDKNIYEYYFLNWDNKIILLQKSSQKLTGADGLNKNNFLADKQLTLPAISSYPKTISIPGRQLLTLEGTGKISSFVDSMLNQQLPEYTFENQKVVDYGEGFVIYVDNLWPVKYNITMPSKFILDNGKTLLTKNYVVGSYKCGGIRGLDTAQYEMKDLEIIGKADNGDNIYKLKNNNENDEETGLMWKSYVGYMGEAESANPSLKYTDYLAFNPLIIMQDKFGRNIRYKLTEKYKTLAECGKPVIYLYPTKDTNINVKVQPNGGFSKTEPTYLDNGWNVRATPQSEIFNYADNTSYPYLFWEGKAYDMTFPDAGFVMKKENVGKDMRVILSKLGLVEKEINDFMEFWQPKLEVKPYVYVTFLPQKDFDRLAPLTVTPRPDKTIRVFMDYQPLDNAITAQPIYITTPVRTGFTVVEWGGRLHK